MSGTVPGMSRNVKGPVTFQPELPDTVVYTMEAIAKPRTNSRVLWIHMKLELSSYTIRKVHRP
ncbi:4658_t:CDS:2 [Funneliformis caledonium]|uniref:4658_t:CDS:1 n=1 Tax=Funneliformis caledonium TaxID=1117310 RepID=A0A9N9BSL7_9GLOM|nr:4658_t:CDS:2 [Funneliformis caledonium]